MLQAGLILKARRRARVALTDYSRYVAPDELPVAHHQLVCDTMDRVFAGELNRVIIMMPPGSAKSTYATVRAPAYLLGRYGKKGVISASYNDTLAEQFGRKVRNLVASEAHQEVFPNSPCRRTHAQKANGKRPRAVSTSRAVSARASPAGART